MWRAVWFGGTGQEGGEQERLPSTGNQLSGSPINPHSVPQPAAPSTSAHSMQLACGRASRWLKLRACCVFDMQEYGIILVLLLLFFFAYFQSKLSISQTTEMLVIQWTLLSTGQKSVLKATVTGQATGKGGENTGLSHLSLHGGVCSGGPAEAPGRPADRDLAMRPELTHCTAEFLAPAEYTNRPCQPPARHYFESEKNLKIMTQF